MKNKSFASLLLILLLSTGLIVAQPYRGERRGNQQPMRMLDLTEEQQTKISDMKLQLQKEIIPIQNKIHNLNSDLKMAMTAEKFDEAKVKKIIAQVSDLREEIQVKRMLHHREVRDLLTPEQQKKFDLYMLSKGNGDKRAGRGLHRGRHGGPGPMHEN